MQDSAGGFHMAPAAPPGTATDFFGAPASSGKGAMPAPVQVTILSVDAQRSMCKHALAVLEEGDVESCKDKLAHTLICLSF